MKNFLKIFIAIDIIVVLLIVLLIVSKNKDASSSTTVSENEKKQVLRRDYEAWIKKRGGVFTAGSATDHVRNYLAQKGYKIGADPSKKVFCYIGKTYFTAREYQNLQFAGMHIELKTFLDYLSQVSVFLQSDMVISDNKSKETVRTVTSMKWGDYDFRSEKEATDAGTANKDKASRYTGHTTLSMNKKPVLKYEITAHGEQFHASGIKVRSNSASYDFLLRHVEEKGIFDVVQQYSAWSWDEKTKSGEYAVGIVLKLKQARNK